jgi:hypothetical protein
MEEMLYNLEQMAREIRYDRNLSKYLWVIDEIERLKAEIEKQRTEDKDYYDL